MSHAIISSRLVWWGQARSAGNPSYWTNAAVTSDGGAVVSVRALTNTVAPAGPGGECAFMFAYLTVTATMSAQLRITPVIDGSSGPVSTPAGTVSFVTPILTLSQQVGSPPQRVTTTFPIPLTQRLVDAGGVERSRWYIRGSRLALLIESINTLGSGELILDGVDVEFDVLRRSLYASVET